MNSNDVMHNAISAKRTAFCRCGFGMKLTSIYESRNRMTRMNDAGGMAILSEFAITDGKSMKLYRDEYSARNLAFSKDSCTIMDLDTLEEVHCDFKKRYEGQGGRLILLSDNYLLVPLAIKPFRDSIKNGLFLSIWTVCYTVFDISKNRRVFAGLVTRTNELEIIDAILMDSADKTKL